MSAYLPNEILIQILARLPVYSLLRFTSVCKSWCFLITSPSFIAKHLNQATTDSKRHSDNLLLRVYTKNERYLLCRDQENFIDEYEELEFPFKIPFGFFRIVGCCNGLLCLSDDYFGGIHNILLWNPSVRKSVALPMPYKPPGQHMSVLGFGAHPTNHECKVVRLVYEVNHLQHKYKVPPNVELYTQGTGSWTGVRSAAPPYCMVSSVWSQAFLNGAVHWVAYDPCVMDGYRNLIVSFHMGSESFFKMMIPPTLANQHTPSLCLKLYGESLAVLFSEKKETIAWSIWVMKEYGVAESWTKLFTINLPGMCVVKALGFRNNGEVLLSTRGNQLVSYVPGTKTLNYAGIRGSSFAFHVETFVETLALLEKQNGVLEGQLNPL